MHLLINLRCFLCLVARYSRQAANWFSGCVGLVTRSPALIASDLFRLHSESYQAEPLLLFLRVHGTRVRTRSHAWDIYWSNLLATALTSSRLHIHSVILLWYKTDSSSNIADCKSSKARWDQIYLCITCHSGLFPSSGLTFSELMPSAIESARWSDSGNFPNTLNTRTLL